MNILITRPLIDAEDLMGKLFSMGHNIIHIPTLKISSSEEKLNKIKKNYDAYIFTSANAVRNLKNIKINKNKPCFCVGSITEKIARGIGCNNTVSAGGTVNALKNLIINSNLINKKSVLAYLCGDNLSFELDKELEKEGYNVDKIINYKSEKITNLNEANIRILKKNPPDIIFVYSARSAQSFLEIIKNYALHPLMTESKVMCISNNVLNIFKKEGWAKIELFKPGEELLKLN